MQTTSSGIILAITDHEAGEFTDEKTGNKVKYGSKRKLKIAFPADDGSSTELEFKVKDDSKREADIAIANKLDTLKPLQQVKCAFKFVATDGGLLRPQLLDIQGSKAA